jgi:hypothetical protein
VAFLKPSQPILYFLTAVKCFDHLVIFGLLGIMKISLKLFCEQWFSCFGLFQICGFGLNEIAHGQILDITQPWSEIKPFFANQINNLLSM